MVDKPALQDLLSRLEKLPQASLVLAPTPLQSLKRFQTSLDGPKLWMKRDDLSGLEGGGNKTRKLEFLVGEALQLGADMLVTVGAIQSNHTRQTAAAAAKVGLKCALLHCAWTQNTNPTYRQVGNILLSHIMDAQLYVNEEARPIDDQGPLTEFMTMLRQQGHKPYLIPGGGSEHRLGSMGYVKCAAELATQMASHGRVFDYLIHCTGSSSTQAGLIAGFKALSINTRVIGISDDGDIEIKKRRVAQLANNTLVELGLNLQVTPQDIEITAANRKAYGLADADIIQAVEHLARTEGLIADAVYEGRAILGLLDLANRGRFEKDAEILLMHLGGAPAIHAYSESFGNIQMRPFSA